MDERRQRRKLEISSSILLGIALGGFFDEIVLHQLLQGHNMLSAHGGYPTDTVAGLEVNILWDGLFYTLTYITVVVGLALLWRAARLPHSPWSTKLLVGLLLMGGAASIWSPGHPPRQRNGA